MRRAAGTRRALLPAVLAALALAGAGCSATPDTPAGLRAWVSAAGFSSSTSLLRGDVSDIDEGIRLGELKATRTACDGLGTDAADAIAVLPTPDHPLTDELNTAYAALVDAAQACSVARSFAPGAFARYREGSGHALAELAAASRRLRSLEAR